MTPEKNSGVAERRGTRLVYEGYVLSPLKNLPDKNMSSILLGVGRLQWNSSESITGRYGMVHLSNDFGPIVLDVTSESEEKTGRLVCKVLETRASWHIGDFSRGIFPSTPGVGERIVLGTGRFFTEECDPAIPHELSAVERIAASTVEQQVQDLQKKGYIVLKEKRIANNRHTKVGLQPLEERDHDWLDPKLLYRCHNQTVELSFETDESSA